MSSILMVVVVTPLMQVYVDTLSNVVVDIVVVVRKMFEIR